MSGSRNGHAATDSPVDAVRALGLYDERQSIHRADCPVCGQGMRLDGRRWQCFGTCSDDAIAAKLAELAGNGSPNGGPPPQIKPYDIAAMVATDPPPVPWVVHGLVVRGCLTVVNGREGEGKSLLTMALGAGVAIGETEAGLQCDRGHVVVIDAENGPWEMHRRVKALGLPTTGVALYEAEGLDLRKHLDALEWVLEKERPDLLVLDSFRSIWRGEENDSGEVAAVLDPLRNLIRRYGAGTILLHHSGKGNGAPYRGSSAIGASAELGFRLARAEDDPDRMRRSLECWKCRPAPEPETRWMRLVVDRGQVYVDEAPPFEAETLAVDAPVRAELRPQILDVLTDEPQKRADIARAVDRESKDRSVGRALQELVDTGAAVRTDDGWRKGGSTRATLPPSDAQEGWQVAPPLGDLPPATPGSEGGR